MKKLTGPLIAVLVFLVILVGGFFIGKYVSAKYNEKNNTNKNLFEILKIVQEDIPIIYPLEEEAKTLKELCDKDTGICNKEVGRIILDEVELKLFIYSDFDNPNDEATTYFKLNDTKIGSFVYLDKFVIINNKYLVVSEINSNDNNYTIHIYDKTGKEVAGYDATNVTKQFEIIENELHFEYCNLKETTLTNEVLLPKVIKYKVNTDNITDKQEESFEYRACT